MLLGVPEALEPIDAARFDELLAPIARGSIERATRASDVSIPPASPLQWSMTPLPFLLVCRRGHLDLTVLRGGRPELVRLHPRHALFCCSRTWLHCDQRHARAYVRFTIAEDYTLYAAVARRDRPPYRPEAGDRLRGLVLSRPLGALGVELVRSLERRGDDREGHRVRVRILALIQELEAALRDDSVRDGVASTWLALRAYVDAHAHLAPSRDEVGRAVGVHPSHVSRLFAEHTGDTFKRYLVSRQLGYAESLLGEPELSVAEVARLSGFDSASYFVRVFHRRTGVTPGRWRRARQRRAHP